MAKHHKDDAADEPKTDAKTVTVRAAQPHTHQGKAYEPGDTYDIAEDLVASVQAQGKAVPVEKPKDDAAPDKASHPVGPMTTDDIK